MDKNNEDLTNIKILFIYIAHRPIMQYLQSFSLSTFALKFISHSSPYAYCGKKKKLYLTAFGMRRIALDVNDKWRGVGERKMNEN
jgi:hypothetical protein